MNDKTGTPKTLDPPDLVRCQAESPNRAVMFPCGRDPVRVRCGNTPAFVAYQREPGSDGRMGCMSLCSDCAERMREQLGDDFADILPADETVIARHGMACPHCGRDDRLSADVTASVQLAHYGWDDDGCSYNLSRYSRCACSHESCGWTGTVEEARAAGGHEA